MTTPHDNRDDAPAAASSAAAAPPAFGYTPVAHDPARAATNLETARGYLAAIEASTRGAPDAAWRNVAAFFAPDVLQEEFPNRFAPSGAVRNLPALRDAAERGRAVLREQRYAVRAAYAVGDVVMLEVRWVGILAVAVGQVPAGGEMSAHFAVVLEFRDGLIHRQRNYDCFDPF